MVDLQLQGQVLLAASVVFFAIGSYSFVLSSFMPLTGYIFLDALAEDKHYKYFMVLLVPTTSYFVIANWVGWQYFRNS